MQKSLVTIVTLAALIASLVVTLPSLRWTQLRHLVAMTGPLPAGDETIGDTGLPPIATRRPNPDVMIIAHRGDAFRAPENTVAAHEAAIAAGVAYIEMDVRLTADDVPVLLHDHTVNRTTDGRGRIDTLTLAEVRALDAGHWFAPEFAGTRIPTLEEALDNIGDRACVLWDTKGPPNALATSLFRRQHALTDCTLVTFGGFGSMAADSEVAALLELWPDAPLLIRVRNRAELAQQWRRYPQIRAIFVPANFLTADLVDAAHAAGLKVVAKALDQSDNPDFYARFAAAGVDGILLADIAAMRSWQAQAESGSLQATDQPASR